MILKCPYCKARSSVDFREDGQEVKCDGCGFYYDLEWDSAVWVRARSPFERKVSRNDPPFFPPPDDPRWFEVLERRWVTNGKAIFREDAPKPHRFACDWRKLHPLDVEASDRFLRRGLDGIGKRFSLLYAPALKVLVPLGRYRFGREGDPIPLAIIMPVHADKDTDLTKTVDERGQP